MTASQQFSLYALAIAPLPCPVCQANLALTQIDTVKPGLDRRTFKCPTCGYIETILAAS